MLGNDVALLSHVCWSILYPTTGFVCSFTWITGMWIKNKNAGITQKLITWPNYFMSVAMCSSNTWESWYICCTTYKRVFTLLCLHVCLRRDKRIVIYLFSVHFVRLTLVLVYFMISGSNESSHTNFMCRFRCGLCSVYGVGSHGKIACCVDGRHVSSPQYVYMYET
jgi:hypothetical protein